MQSVNPRQNKNDYSCIVFLENGRVMSMAYVHNIYALHSWLTKKGAHYKYINIYLRRTNQYISRQYPNAYIIQKP